ASGCGTFPTTTRGASATRCTKDYPPYAARRDRLGGDQTAHHIHEHGGEQILAAEQCVAAVSEDRRHVRGSLGIVRQAEGNEPLQTRLSYGLTRVVDPVAARIVIDVVGLAVCQHQQETMQSGLAGQ